MKTELVLTEKHILKNLAFYVNVQHPHKLVVSFLHMLEARDHPTIPQLAWSYVNDRCGGRRRHRFASARPAHGDGRRGRSRALCSFLSNVHVRYQPNAIAAAAIMLACRDAKHALPQNPPWWLLFETTLPGTDEGADRGPKWRMSAHSLRYVVGCLDPQRWRTLHATFCTATAGRCLRPCPCVPSSSRPSSRPKRPPIPVSRPAIATTRRPPPAQSHPPRVFCIALCTAAARARHCTVELTERR